MKKEPYHYIECGLDNIYLANGFEIKKTPRGKAVTIHDLEGLHKAIVHYLLGKKVLDGKEFRFLRHFLDISQSNLAEFFRLDGQTVARWEKGDTPKIPGAAESVLRALCNDKLKEEVPLMELLELLREIDQLNDEELTLVNTNGEWEKDAA